MFGRLSRGKDAQSQPRARFAPPQRCLGCALLLRAASRRPRSHSTHSAANHGLPRRPRAAGEAHGPPLPHGPARRPGGRLAQPAALPRAQAQKGEPPHGKKAIKSPRGGGEISWSRARQFPDRAAQSGYDSPERDFVGTHLNRKIIPVPLEETLEHRLGFKGRVRDRRNGIPKIGLKEVVDMWPGYMKQEGLIPGQCIVDNRTPDNVVPKPHKVTPFTYEEKKRRDRLRGEMGDVSGLTNALGEGDDALASWEERTGYYVWKTKAVRAGEEAPSAAPSARASRASRDSEASQAEPEAAPG